MEILISKQEISRLNKEPKRVINNYRDKNAILAELIYIKTYNLLKYDFNRANKYLNRIFPISSFCKDFNLVDYDIEDINILITFENNILSGFVFGRIHGSTDVFINIIKISNDLILEVDKRYDLIIKKPSIIAKLLNSSNIKSINELIPLTKKELTKRFNAEFEDKLHSNIFIASQFRKETFDSISDAEKKKLLKIDIKDELSVGEYIYKLCKENVSDSTNIFITRMLNELQNNFSSDILNIDLLYKKVSSSTEQSIMKCLNSKIHKPFLITSPFLLIDLMFVKDKIKVFKNRDINLDNEITRRKFISKKIDKLNSILKEIDAEICTVYNQFLQKTFSISYTNRENVRCYYYSLREKKVEIDGCKYDVNCLYFARLNEGHLILDNPFHLDNILNLTINYRKQVLYSTSEETRDKLLKAQKELSSIIDVSKKYVYIN